MEKYSTETAAITINASTSELEDQHLKSKGMDKQQVISLLKKYGVKDTHIIEDQNVTVQEIIPTLRKAKVDIPEDFYKSLSTKLNFIFLSRKEMNHFCLEEQDNKILAVLPYRVIEDYQIIPLRITKTTAELALANPFNHKIMTLLPLLLGERQISWHLASSKSIEIAIEKVYGEIHKQKALLELYYRNPDESAHKVLFSNQKYCIIGTLIVISAALLISSAITFAILFTILNIGYFIINPLKIYISAKGFQKTKNDETNSTRQTQEKQDENWPVFTILMPVYQEGKVLQQVMKNVYQLDYPKEKLDIKILMEEKDEETISEAKRLGLFGESEIMVEGIPPKEYRQFLEAFDPVIIPKSDITTKPRACNYGLLRAKGKYCVIYDAEDNPDKDQIKKAALAFSQAADNVTCLQSKLNFYNANEALLPRWFSIEYSYWFDCYLKGLEKVDAPIPLGGTSNHFRIDQLRELGGWDSYNVTEDADIGVRMARRKMKTKMLESYTYEEAPVKAMSWIKQRSRWYKGHLQTYLVHMRHPVKLLRDLKPKKFMLFQFTFGGAVFMPIINPILWATFAISIFAPGIFSGLIILPIQGLCIFNLIVGNSAYVLMYLVSCVRTKKYKAIPLALTMPAYWVLISVAAWRGLTQLVTKPFYWEKTSHGITKNSKQPTI